MALRTKSFVSLPTSFLLLAAITLFNLPFALSAGLKLWDASPRAAFVALVSENQLEQMVASVGQLEQRFNGKYRYDWVFFSHEELSEKFKEATSNATGGTVTYNVIPKQHWSIPAWVDSVGANKADVWTTHHKRRWSAGLFAREKRLDAYDWFWMVEPGTQFMCDINVDVFRLMRDRDIAYGVNEVMFEDTSEPRSLFQSTKSFMDEHPEMVQPQADISWILGHDGTLGTPTINARFDEFDDSFFEYRGCNTSQMIKGGVHPGVPQEADPQQCEPNTVADAYTTRLAADYNQCTVDAPIEIGNLKYFRGPEHKSYFEHLDNAGDFYYNTVSNVPVHSLSATMFLPRDKFWLLGDMVCEMHGLHSCPPMPRQTLRTDALQDQPVMADVLGSTMMSLPEGFSGVREELHGRWENFVEDFDRQDKMPHSLTGCTCTEERTFKNEQWYMEIWVQSPSGRDMCRIGELTFGLRDYCAAMPQEHELSMEIPVTRWIERMIR
ncbi:Glycolipid 2-alpha-mannosyltransferase 1 [Colletotrichum fructicola]|nr:Glycolipid 2-alpha-mannosyltransferase 1 [Colletotrichum fructicola]